MVSSDSSRVIVKNLPLTLDATGIEKLIAKKCKEISLSYTDCKVLKSLKGKIKNLDIKSRGLCYVGFLNSKDASKFLSFYNGTYFMGCKVTIEVSKPPASDLDQSQRDLTGKSITSGKGQKPNFTKSSIIKAGVSQKQKHIIFDEAQEEPVSINEDHRLDTPEGVEKMDRVVIFNLPYNVTEGKIRELCKPFGPIKEIHIPLNKGSLEPGATTKGYCYVTWSFPIDAIKFRDARNRSIFCGRIIYIYNAKERVGREIDMKRLRDTLADSSMKASSYKKRVAESRLVNVENSLFWNTIHVDIHAVVSRICGELDLDLEGVYSEDAAVNVALSETFVVGQLTQWLEREGIDYKRTTVVAEPEQQEKPKEPKAQPRSNDTIIIKNLAPDCIEMDLIQLFSPFGDLLKFSVSPYMVMAIVQYLEPEAARKAFQSLAYKCYKGLPLYLEWAPKNFFLPSEAPKATLKVDKIPTDQSKSESQLDESKPESQFNDLQLNDLQLDESKPESQLEDSQLEDSQLETWDQPEANTSLYLKNLDFKVREDDLKDVFGKCPGYVTSKVILKDTNLSMGFGFVEFDTKENAMNAIRSKTGVSLKGKRIEISISKAPRKESTEVRTKVDVATKKIIVKNLAFQTTKKEIYKLFSYYGNIKSVRIPKSTDKQNRGFAFVEFVNKAECIRAFESLQHTHLYGRHLILEFSN